MRERPWEAPCDLKPANLQRVLRQPALQKFPDKNQAQGAHYLEPAVF